MLVYGQEELRKIWIFILLLGETHDDRETLIREGFSKLFSEKGALPIEATFEFLLGFWRAKIERSGAYMVPSELTDFQELTDLQSLAPDFRVFCLEKLFRVKVTDRPSKDHYENVWNFKGDAILSLLNTIDGDEEILLLRHVQREALKPDERTRGHIRKGVMIIILMVLIFLMFRGSLLKVGIVP